MSKKPSERIGELCRTVCARRGKHQPNSHDLEAALPQAVVVYLDEVHAEFEEVRAAVAAADAAPVQPQPDK